MEGILGLIRWCAPNIVMKNIVESVVKVSFSFLLFLICFRKHINCHVGEILNGLGSEGFGYLQVVVS